MQSFANELYLSTTVLRTVSRLGCIKDISAWPWSHILFYTCFTQRLNFLGIGFVVQFASCCTALFSLAAFVSLSLSVSTDPSILLLHCHCNCASVCAHMFVYLTFSHMCAICVEQKKKRSAVDFLCLYSWKINSTQRPTSVKRHSLLIGCYQQF